MDMIIPGIGWYAAFILSVTFHEAAHSFVAMKLGDFTAYHGGQVTLDPVPHMRREPFGMIIVPVLSYLMGGWMLGWGSAPYDPAWALDHPRRSCWMSLAGPAANLVLILTTAALIRLGLLFGLFEAPDSVSLMQAVASQSKALTGVTAFISILFSLNLILFFFNLLPLPPLDGSALPLLFLNPRWSQQYLQLLYNPSYAFIGILIAWHMFGGLFKPLHLASINLLYLGVAHYG